MTDVKDRQLSGNSLEMSIQFIKLIKLGNNYKIEDLLSGSRAIDSINGRIEVLVLLDINKNIIRQDITMNRIRMVISDLCRQMVHHLVSITSQCLIWIIINRHIIHIINKGHILIVPIRLLIQPFMTMISRIKNLNEIGNLNKKIYSFNKILIF